MMKNNVIGIAWCITLLLLFPACREQVVPRYESENSIYFYNGADVYNTFVQRDSLKYNFMNKTDDRERDTVHVHVFAAGFLSDEDRSYKLVQANHGGATDAEAGIHYVRFDDPAYEGRFVIPAGTMQGSFPVILLRDPSLRSREIRVEFELQANEHFMTIIPDQSRFVVKITDMFSQPDNWEALWQFYFGVWGPEKMRFLKRYVGIDDFEYAYPPNRLMHYQSEARKKLAEYNANNPPLTEEGGIPISFD
jgi:hypothetical protein